MLASAYATTATTAEFSANSFGTICPGYQPRVVIIEIETAVLDRTERRHARFFHRLDICPAVLNQIEMPAPDSCKIAATGANIFFTSGSALILTPIG